MPFTTQNLTELRTALGQSDMTQQECLAEIGRLRHCEFVLSIREQELEKTIEAMREIGATVDVLYRGDDVTMKSVVRQVKRLRNDYDALNKVKP